MESNSQEKAREIAAKPPLTCLVRVPGECSASQLKRFQELVEEGDEVMRDRLDARIRRAIALAFLFDEQTQVGVAGLKRPTRQYRARVMANSGAALPAAEFPYELGWVYIQPIARHRHGTSLLVDSLLAHQPGTHVYATSASDKTTMHYWLERAGLRRVGEPYLAGERLIYVFSGPAANKK